MKTRTPIHPVVIRRKSYLLPLVGIAACLLLAMNIVGCDLIARNDWQKAPRTHSCTAEQMEKSQTEAEWCSKNTSYFSSYCYGSAIMRNCTKNKEAP